VIVATTMKFVLGKDGWSYLACNCYNRITKQVSAFKCTTCDGYNLNAAIKLVY